MTRSTKRKAILQFEHKSQPLQSLSVFLERLIVSFTLGMSLIVASLFAGMCGYHFFEKLSWIDSFANAAMILSGMGPLAQPVTIGGKIFAGVYALYSGLAVVMIAGITFAPIVHRFLHKLHADPDD
ncbi:MAG: hypothetical protein KA368_15975 [Acidobacteria bacterium]|nr:hypothetical protein [Acidobacteriota bacterium]